MDALRVSKNRDGIRISEKAPDTGDGSHDLRGKMSFIEELNPPAGNFRGTKKP